MIRELMGLTGICRAMLGAKVAHKDHKVASFGENASWENRQVFCYWATALGLRRITPIGQAQEIDLPSVLTSPQEIRVLFSFHRRQERHSLGVLTNAAYNGRAAILPGNAPPLRKEKQLAGNPWVFSIHLACRSLLYFVWNVWESRGASCVFLHDHRNQSISRLYSCCHRCC